MKRNDFEHQEQVALFTWAEYSKGKYPELALLYAIPNAAKRSLKMGAYMKAEGLKAGVPDVCLPVKKQYFGQMPEYIGLYIEMKHGKNKPTAKQIEWHDKLREAGHRVEVCYSWTETRDVIIEYLEG